MRKNLSIDEQKKAIVQKKRELEKTEKRVKELNVLFRRIYEDNLSGKITDERFSTMSAAYETEQAEKKQLAETLIAEISTEKEQTDGLEKFIGMVKSVTAPTKLSPELVHQFISRIVVHWSYRDDGKRHQDIDICYTGVGIICSANPEDTERAFQEHLKIRKQRTKEKTEQPSLTDNCSA